MHGIMRFNRCVR